MSDVRSELQEIISRNLKIIMVMRGVKTRADLVPVLGLNKDSIYGKFRAHRPWLLTDITKLAVFFGYSEQAFTCDAEDIPNYDLGGRK